MKLYNCYEIVHAIISYDAIVNDELVHTVSSFFWFESGFLFCNQICVSYGIVIDRFLFQSISEHKRL